MNVNRKLCLFIGLATLLIAYVAKWADAPLFYFRILLGMAISFKSIFLILVFREKGFKPGPGLYLILAGVAMILLSMFFKNIFPVMALHTILFYGAILLKISGLVLMLYSKKARYSK
ncbi:MAG: hypothetical protein LIP04_10780 [Tannerellaceae bacterium]|nr:hypothetical protein [Tannerellaceae bacterium]